MAKLKNVYFAPEAVLQGGRERISQLTGEEARIALEPGGHLLRVRVPAKRIEFAVAAVSATLEYEYEDEKPVDVEQKGKFKP